MNEYIYRGAIENLQLYGNNPLVFTGRKTIEKIKPLVEKYLNNPYYYNDFSTNPK